MDTDVKLPICGVRRVQWPMLLWPQHQEALGYMGQGMWGHNILVYTSRKWTFLKAELIGAVVGS